MAFKVTIDIDRTITVSADPATVFALLSDVPASAKHFPKVDDLVDLGDGTYRWEMEKVGLGDHAIQTIYASNYVADEASKTIEWTPISGEGNAEVSGKWTITESGEGSEVRLDSSADMELPMPKLLKMAIAPVVKHEFTSMVETYLENIQEALNG